MVLSQEWRLVAKPLAALTGRVRAWHNPAYSEDQRQALVAEASKYQGSLYDWLGIGGQILRMVPVVGAPFDQDRAVPLEHLLFGTGILHRTNGGSAFWCGL